jgi:hypothetical protein
MRVSRWLHQRFWFYLFGASCGVIAFAAATNNVGRRSACGEKCMWGDEVKCYFQYIYIYIYIHYFLSYRRKLEGQCRC